MQAAISKLNDILSRPLKRAIRRLTAKLGYRIEGIRYTPRQLLDASFLRPLEFDDVICRRMFEAGPELTFVQVGAFDGVANDPLRKYIERCNWRGVMVEPQPEPAMALRKLYTGNDRVRVIQAAVDAQRGRKTLFTVPGSSQLASFDKRVIAKHDPGQIIEVPVECVTFEDILPGGEIDLLQIDAEGADAFLLSLFPFDRLRPAIVHFEVKHLSKLAREECFERLVGYGYRLAPSGGEDMMAVY